LINQPQLLPLLLAVAVIGSNSLSFGPIAPDIASDLAADIDVVMYASAAFGLGTGLSALILARWIDFFGPLRVLRVTGLILTFAFFGCWLSGHVVTLVVMQLLAGIAAGTALPAVYAQAARLAPLGRESRVLGQVLFGWTISLVAGVSLAALLADHFGWRSVFLCLGLISLLVLWGIHRLASQEARAETNELPKRATSERGESSRVVPKRVAAKRLAPSPIAAFRVSGVPVLLLLVALYMISFYGSYSFVGDHVVQVLGKSLSANAWIAAVYGIGFGLATYLDSVLDKFGATIATPATLLLLSGLYLALFLVGQFQVLVAMAFFWGLFNHLAVNVLIARLGNADSAQRGTILGLYSGITYLCMSLATLLAGLVYQAAGWPVLNLAGTALCLLAALISLPAAIRRYGQRVAS